MQLAPASISSAIHQESLSPCIKLAVEYWVQFNHYWAIYSWHSEQVRALLVWRLRIQAFRRKVAQNKIVQRIQLCHLLKMPFGFYSLVHPVVLDVPMEGNLITDKDIDGVAFNAVLLLFLFLGAEGEVRGPTPFPRCITVCRWLNVDGPSQLPIGSNRLEWKISPNNINVLVSCLYRARGGERGAC